MGRSRRCHASARQRRFLLPLSILKLAFSALGNFKTKQLL